MNTEIKGQLNFDWEKDHDALITCNINFVRVFLTRLITVSDVKI